MEVLAAGGAAPTVLNAANEIAVAAFLQRRLTFPGIAGLVAATLDAISPGKAPETLAEALELDASSRRGRRGPLARNRRKGILRPVPPQERNTRWIFISALSAFGGGILGYVLPFLFVLTIVVFFHEFGHFWVARRCGVKVEAFSIGFGPEIVGFNDRHGTRWRIGAVPLGGYVRFFGDENAASVPDGEAVRAMTEAERRVSFFHKPVWQRAAVVAAGPLANFLLAIVIFAGIYTLYGKQITAARVDVVEPGSAGRHRRLQGRRRGEVDQRAARSAASPTCSASSASMPARQITVEVDRGGVRQQPGRHPAAARDQGQFRQRHPHRHPRPVALDHARGRDP